MFFVTVEALPALPSPIKLIQIDQNAAARYLHSVSFSKLQLFRVRVSGLLVRSLWNCIQSIRRRRARLRQACVWNQLVARLHGSSW